MMTYTFSTREKVMLGVLAVVVVFIAWYQFVYSNIQNQIQSLDTEISSVQDQFIVVQSRVASYSEMRQAVDKFEAQGLEPVTVPTFDNTQNLMAFLHGILAASEDYSMSFNVPYLDNEDGSVHRDGTIEFKTGTYAAARDISENIARGIYPCRVKAISIAEDGGRSSAKSAVTYRTSMSVTFLENPSGKETAAESDSEEREGNDWSVMQEVL